MVLHRAWRELALTSLGFQGRLLHDSVSARSRDSSFGWIVRRPREGRSPGAVDGCSGEDLEESGDPPLSDSSPAGSLCYESCEGEREGRPDS